MTMKPIKKCKFCGSNAFLYKYEQLDKNFNISENFSIKECNGCGVVWTDPQLTNEDFEKYYPKDYYAFDRITEDLWKVRLRVELFDIFYNENKNNLLFKHILLPFKFLVRGTKIYPGNKILDIGCGSGQFLYEMRECGMEVYGVEPSFSVKSEFDLEPDLIKAQYPDENFDLITMNHVLQHTDNPVEMLEEVHRVLKQDGLFIVSISNTRSLASKVFEKNWFQLDIPRHLFNLSDKRLIEIIEENGFEVIKNRHNSRPNQFVISLYYLLGIKYTNAFITRSLEVLFLPLTWLVNIFKIGDQVELWCVKK